MVRKDGYAKNAEPRNPQSIKEAQCIMVLSLHEMVRRFRNGVHYNFLPELKQKPCEICIDFWPKLCMH
jgi:hypothetical protein